MAANRSVSPYLLVTLAPFFWACNWIIGRGLAGRYDRRRAEFDEAAAVVTD